MSSIVQHYLTSSTIYDEHSPFFYDLWDRVIRTPMPKTESQVLTSQRQHLRADNSIIQRRDFGSGHCEVYQQRIGNFAQRSLGAHWKLSFIAKLACHIEARNILEMGTGLGLSSAYISLLNPDSNIHTLDGDPELIARAKEVHKSLNLNNVTFHVGPFNDHLYSVASLKYWDIIYIDGHHDGEATKDYFSQVIDNIHPGSIIILDDVYYTPDMFAAWEKIKLHPKVTSSLLYFDLGLLFFDATRPYDLHLKWVDRWMKPWGVLRSI